MIFNAFVMLVNSVTHINEDTHKRRHTHTHRREHRTEHQQSLQLTFNCN